MSIDGEAFADCVNLRLVYFSTVIVENSRENIFQRCPNLSLVRDYTFFEGIDFSE